MLYLKHVAPSGLKDQLDSRLILQDYAVKMENLKESLILTDQEASTYPAWLVAVKIPSCPGVHDLKNRAESIFVGIGLYGLATSKNYAKEESIQKFEKHCLENGG